MSGMIERVARAIWEVRREQAGLVSIELEEWGDGSIPRANHIMEEARAAIAAMREPTGIMAVFGERAGIEWLSEAKADMTVRDARPFVTVEIYKAMIGEALKP